MQLKKPMEDKSYKEYLEHITTFIFDVDGVLTDGTITVTTSGDMLRTMNIKDGYALKTAVSKGFHVCIIAVGTIERIIPRPYCLVVSFVFLVALNKRFLFTLFLEKHLFNARNVLFMEDDFLVFPVLTLGGLLC